MCLAWVRYFYARKIRKAHFEGFNAVVQSQQPVTVRQLSLDQYNNFNNKAIIRYPEDIAIRFPFLCLDAALLLER